MKKTNAMRILDGMKIPYEATEYSDDGEHELEKGAAEETAKKLGINPKSVFKTIVMQSETKETLVFCQNALCEINLKKARNVAGVKEVNPVKPNELLSLTGYIRGGCSPLGMKRKFRTFIDKTALEEEKIYVSAGMRGMQLCLKPEDLVKATDAAVCDLILE